MFAPIGGALLYASSKVQEIIIDYSACNRTAPPCPTFEQIPSDKITAHFKNASDPGDAPTWCRNLTDVNYGPDYTVSTPTCHIQFNNPDTLNPPVLLYYQLTNFYQNHRRYVKSFDQDQLKGQARSHQAIEGSDCDPLQIDPHSQKPYYPCGLIANSRFNDTFHSPTLLNAIGSSDSDTVYRMSNEGIAWSSDKDLYGETDYNYDDVVPPPNWRKKYPAYNETFPFPDLSTLR